MKIFKLFFAATIIAGFSTVLNAQEASDEITASATIMQFVSIDDTEDLVFGNVIISDASTHQVNNDEDGAGRFDINTNTELVLNFNLPENLAGTTGLAGQTNANLPISFSATDARLHNGTEDDVNVDPNSAISVTNGSNGEFIPGQFSVFIGGSLSPDDNQESGDYEGTITLSIDYAGV